MSSRHLVSAQGTGPEQHRCVAATSPKPWRIRPSLPTQDTCR